MCLSTVIKVTVSWNGYVDYIDRIRTNSFKNISIRQWSDICI